MYIFFEKSTTVGISYIYNVYYRHSKANNKHLKSYDPKELIKKWLDPKKFNLNKYISNRSKGCALEVDPEYPKKITKIT